MQIQGVFYSKINNKFNETNSLRVSYPSNADKVTFSGASSLLRRYKINPDEIQVISPKMNSIDKQTKEVLIKKLLEAHEHAKKNVLIGNITNSGYATNIGLIDGSWGEAATNFNDTSLTSVCGERSSVLVLFNKTIKKISLKKLKTNPEYKNQFQDNFKAKYLVMSSDKPIGTDKNASSPCADCLSWFNTDKIFRDDTQIVFFDKDETGKLCLKMRELSEALPYRNEKNSLIVGSKKLHELDFNITPDAVSAMKEKNISEKQILELMQNAQNARELNKGAKYTMENIGAAVMTDAHQIEIGKKFEWSRRWSLEPAETACLKAIESSPAGAKIDAVAYYGNGTVIDAKGVEHRDGVVSLLTLGKLKIEHGSESTLVVSVADNKIAVRTVNDYMPQQFNFIYSYLNKPC